MSSIVNQSTSVEKTPLKKISEISDNELIGMFLETNWGVITVGKKKYDKEDGKCIDHFKTLDSTEDKQILAYDESEQSLRISTKGSRQSARRHLATTKNINRIRWFAPEIIGAKPTVVRGKKCDSVNDGYAIIGKRPDRLSSENGVYVFKKHVSHDMKTKLEKTKPYSDSCTHRKM